MSDKELEKLLRQLKLAVSQGDLRLFHNLVNAQLRALEPKGTIKHDVAQITMWEGK